MFYNKHLLLLNKSLNSYYHFFQYEYLKYTLQQRTVSGLVGSEYLLKIAN